MNDLQCHSTTVINANKKKGTERNREKSKLWYMTPNVLTEG